MYEASFVGFIRTIFFIILFYYGIKILARIFMPFLMKYFLNKVGTNFQQSQNKKQEPQEPKTEPTPKKKTVGEYIDYEEID